MIININIYAQSELRAVNMKKILEKPVIVNELYMSFAPC